MSLPLNDARYRNAGPLRPTFQQLLAIIALFSLILIVIRAVDPAAERQSLSAHGVLDWTGHLLTAGIIAIGLAGWRRAWVPVLAILGGGVLPDIGHLLTALELAEPVAGSSRNGTHSALVVGAIAALAVLDRRRCAVWIGVSIGAATHLWRDMGTGTVPFFWPWSDRVVGVSFAQYLAGTIAAGVLLLAAGFAWDRWARRR